jgi:hypothetical protein
MLVAGTVLAASTVAACDDHTPMRIPPGAQQVHVVENGGAVLLNPSTVRAGDVYLVIEGPVSFIQHAAAAEGEQPGSMTDEQLSRLAQKGDTYLTVIEGGMGSVAKFTLAAGKYAFVADVGTNPLMARADLCYRDPVTCAALPPLPIAVLEVLP